jgi:hypothetical protein
MHAVTNRADHSVQKSNGLRTHEDTQSIACLQAFKVMKKEIIKTYQTALGQVPPA